MAMAILLILGLESAYLLIVFRSWVVEGVLTTTRIALLVLAQILYFLLLSNFAACALSTPDTVPHDGPYSDKFTLCPDTGTIVSSPDVPLKDMPRWCHVCTGFKPPRAHHCQSCQRCILKMDHHCPWMGTCVGLSNHAHFVRFLVYVVGCLVVNLVASTWWFLDNYYYIDHSNYVLLGGDWRLVLMVFTVTVSIGTVFFVGALAAYHIRAVYQNKTTIEAMEEERLLRQLTKDQLKDYMFPYTLPTPADNVAVTMGNYNWYFYPFPVPFNKTRFDGLTFAVHPQSPFQGQWPVRFKELEDLEGDHSNLMERESREYRRRIRRDSEGYTLPSRLFPELALVLGGDNTTISLSEPHLATTDATTVTERRVTRSLSPPH
jgi:palmitoyltransferase